MAELSFLTDLAVVMIVAAAATVLFHRLKQPVVLGLIAAGLLIGPHTFAVPLIRNEGNTIGTLAELGILFIMFSLGLEFNLSKLRKVGGFAFAAASIELLFMLFAGFAVGRLFGWAFADSLFLAAILAISSSSIIVTILTEMGKLDEESSQVLFAVLLAEDVAAVIIIALLSGGVEGIMEPSLQVAGLVLLKVAIFVTAAIILGLLAVPWLVDRVRELRSDMVLTITVLGLIFGIGILGATLNFSLALGGFLVGALIAESRSASEVAERVAPLRDTFTAVFFVAVGLQLDPRVLATYWFPILVIAVVSIVGKIVAGSFATFLAGYPPRTAFQVGVGLAMIGEFSFIIAGLAYGIVEVPLFAIAVTVSAITTFVTPSLIRGSDRLLVGIGRVVPAPVRTYATLYGPWVQRLRASAKTRDAFLPGVPRGTVARLLIYGFLLAGLLVSANTLERLAVSQLGTSIFLPGDVRLLLWASMGLVGLPVALLLFRNLRLIVDGLTEAAIPERFHEEEVGGVVRALRTTFWFAATMGIGAVTLVLALPFLPSAALLVAVAIVVGASVFFLWDGLRRMHENVESAVEAVLGSAPAQSRPSRDQVMHLIQEQYPWDAHLVTVVVPARSAAAHRRVRELDLRRITGASIVSITRRGRGRPRPPDPDTLIEPGDALVLLGEREQLDAARSLLLSTAGDPGHRVRGAGDGLILQEAELAAGSVLAGASLAETRLREKSGVTVLSVKRGVESFTNPDPGLRLETGDRLVLWGTLENVERARALIERGSPQEEPPSAP